MRGAGGVFTAAVLSTYKLFCEYLLTYLHPYNPLKGIITGMKQPCSREELGLGKKLYDFSEIKRMEVLKQLLNSNKTENSQTWLKLN
ncbi:MAG: hypothetical protein LPJ89_10145 [Hymenobacteraceae bacterium]|nr:hypothetical protein [Hymenobacteraceae bacterium]